MADVSGISASENTEAFLFEELEEALSSTKTKSLDSKALGQLEDKQIDTQHLSLMRQVAALGARVLEMLQRLSQNGKDSTKSLENSIKNNTKLKVDTMTGGADFTAGIAFLSWTVSIVAAGALSGGNQAIAQALTQNFEKMTDVYSTKTYRAPGEVYRMKADLASAKRQDEANKQQSQGSFKGTVENLVAEACRNHGSLARGG